MRTGLGSKFLDEVGEYFDRITQNPERYQMPLSYLVWLRSLPKAYTSFPFFNLGSDLGPTIGF